MRIVLPLYLVCALFVSCKREKGSDGVNPAQEKKPAIPKKRAKTPSMQRQPMGGAVMASPPIPTKPPQKAAAVKVEIPLLKGAKEVQTPVVHKTLTVGKEELIALDSLTLPGGKRVFGFNKKIPVGVTVLFKKSGEIYRVFITSHKETPDWITRMDKEFLQKFNGLKPTDPITKRGKQGIDALSAERRESYNRQRNSKVFEKRL